jgi:glyoxylase-like metal-dependent hydrolase (beta-lactamase superfamily II)
MYQAITERVGLIPGGVNIGLLRTGPAEVVLVDTGLNDSAAKKALRVVRDELQAEVKGIITTHAHADHFGGNSTVVKRTGAPVWAPPFDEAVLRYPLLQPIFLFGGADPLDTLRGRFLLADASPVDHLLTDGEMTFGDLTVEVINLAGHSVNQQGILVDGVFFCADVVFPDAALDKYKVPYLYSLTDHLMALETASKVECATVVPGHGPAEEGINRLVSRNREVIDGAMSALVDLLRDEPDNTDTLCTRLFECLRIVIADDPAYFLMRPTIAAYLNHLVRAGKVRHTIKDGAERWSLA